ncbi:MAG: hypothetical protein H6575_09260 [Lewinellaceae bacterium]|nr:hypothetical protein [Lewinellaceae bacterium]
MQNPGKDESRRRENRKKDCGAISVFLLNMEEPSFLQKATARVFARGQPRENAPPASKNGGGAIHLQHKQKPLPNQHHH